MSRSETIGAAWKTKNARNFDASKEKKLIKIGDGFEAGLRMNLFELVLQKKFSKDKKS